VQKTEKLLLILTFDFVSYFSIFNVELQPNTLCVGYINLPYTAHDVMVAHWSWSRKLTYVGPG